MIGLEKISDQLPMVDFAVNISVTMTPSVRYPLQTNSQALRFKFNPSLTTMKGVKMRALFTSKQS